MDRQYVVRMFAPFALVLLSASTVLAQSAGTKSINAITFQPGIDTTVIEGSVAPPVTAGPDRTNEGSERYTLHATAGQQLTMEMSSDNHHAMFSLIKPSPAMATQDIVEKAGAVKRWSGRLSISGNYMIVVATQDRKAASRFSLRVTLRQAPP